MCVISVLSPRSTVIMCVIAVVLCVLRPVGGVPYRSDHHRPAGASTDGAERRGGGAAAAVEGSCGCVSEGKSSMGRHFECKQMLILIITTISQYSTLVNVPGPQSSADGLSTDVHDVS